MDDEAHLITIESITKAHKAHFGIEPRIIGARWHDRWSVIEGIEEAIETNKPYDEYLEMSEEMRHEYDNGRVF